MAEVHCGQCPLRQLPVFVENTTMEIELVQSLKQSELRLNGGEFLIIEGQQDARLYTLLKGWAYRFKTLSDGRIQILSFLLPGDFIGVQQKMSDVAAHGVITLTDAVFCVFKRDSLWELHRHSPEMGFNLTWLIAQEESIVDETLLSVGQRHADERIAALLIKLFKRAAVFQADQGESGVLFPLTQQHIADALGLSLVHTNKTLRRLERLGFHFIANGMLHLLNVNALERLADLVDDAKLPQHPLV